VTTSSFWPRKIKACPWILRHHFNEMRIDERSSSGELIVQVTKTHLTRASYQQPLNTTTDLLTYRTPAGLVVALAVVFRRPDGSFGASGRPDPKYVLVDGEALVPSHAGERSDDCPECQRRARL
jgi:hypothetical protein